MDGGWHPNGDGVLALPSGRLVRGRGVRHGLPDGPLPEFGVYLLGRRPQAMPWPSRWVRWPEFALPLDGGAARRALVEAWTRATSERVEVACAGGLAGRVRRSRASRCSMVCPAPKQSVTCERTTPLARWRRPGSAAMSSASPVPSASVSRDG